MNIMKTGKRGNGMKNIFKRNQLIILVISLMLITAGYLNFTSNSNLPVSSKIADREDETIGDAQLVDASIVGADSISAQENTTTVQDADSKNINNAVGMGQSEELSEINTNAEISENDDYYFEKSKLERNNMYSELLETYQEIYNNVNSTNEQKKDAIDKITLINNTKNSIMIAENLIKAKGFENLVIFVNDDSISVIVKSNELEQEKVAQIQNIISRELKVDADKIHISNK